METRGNQMDSAELLRRIRDEINCKVEVPGPEWKTSRQWMQEWGMQLSQTNRMISIAVRAGIMERKVFRVSCDGRPHYPVPHYRARDSAP